MYSLRSSIRLPTSDFLFPTSTSYFRLPADYPNFSSVLLDSCCLGKRRPLTLPSWPPQCEAYLSTCAVGAVGAVSAAGAIGWKRLRRGRRWRSGCRRRRKRRKRRRRFPLETLSPWAPLAPPAPFEPAPITFHPIPFHSIPFHSIPSRSNLLMCVSARVLAKNPWNPAQRPSFAKMP